LCFLIRNCKIKKDNVELLLKWGGEYQITGPVACCEKYLKGELKDNGVEDVIAQLSLEIEYKLVGLLWWCKR
jgi:hypothetical protein